jgi:hypothetical protein
MVMGHAITNPRGLLGDYLHAAGLRRAYPVARD